MKPFALIAKKPAAGIAVMLLAAAGLAACGGGGGSTSPPASGTATPTPTSSVTDPAPVADAFVAPVSTVVENSADNMEPGSIDAIVATPPEDTETQPLT